MLRWTLLTRCFGAPLLEEGQQHLAPCRHSPPAEACNQPAFPPTTRLTADTTARCDDALVCLTAASGAQLDASTHKLLQLVPIVPAAVDVPISAASTQQGPISPKASGRMYKVNLQGQPAAIGGRNNSHSYMRRCSDFMLAVQAVQQSALLRSVQPSFDEEQQQRAPPPAEQPKHHTVLSIAGQTQQLAQQQRQQQRLEAVSHLLLHQGSLDGLNLRRQLTANTCDSVDGGNRAAAGSALNDATHRGATYVATWQRGLTARRAERWAALARGASIAGPPAGGAFAALTAAYASLPSGPDTPALSDTRASGRAGLSSPIKQQQLAMCLTQLSAGNDCICTHASWSCAACRAAPQLRVGSAMSQPMGHPVASPCEDEQLLDLLNACAVVSRGRNAGDDSLARQG